MRSTYLTFILSLVNIFGEQKKTHISPRFGLITLDWVQLAFLAIKVIGNFDQWESD